MPFVAPCTVRPPRWRAAACGCKPSFWLPSATAVVLQILSVHCHSSLARFLRLGDRRSSPSHLDHMLFSQLQLKLRPGDGIMNRRTSCYSRRKLQSAVTLSVRREAEHLESTSQASRQIRDRSDDNKKRTTTQVPHAQHNLTVGNKPRSKKNLATYFLVTSCGQFKHSGWSRGLCTLTVPQAKQVQCAETTL